MKLIDGEAFAERLLSYAITDDQRRQANHIEKVIEEMPESVVRCKDCKYYIPYEWMFDGLSRSSRMEDYAPDEIGCSVNDHNYPPEGFCSNAERREE